MTTFLIVLMLLVSIFMILVVLVQRGRGGGLSGAFGSGGGSNSAFGTKTGDVFTTITVVAFVVFMLLAIALSFRFRGNSVIATTAPAAGKAVPPMTGDIAPTGTMPTTMVPGAAPAASTRVAPEMPASRPAMPSTPAAPAMTSPASAPAAPTTRP